VVVIRFGRDENESCMQMDEILYKISEDVRNFAVIYLVDVSEVRARVCVRVCTEGPVRRSRSWKWARRAAQSLLPHRKRTKQVPDFNVMYELYDECTLMFFFRNKHIMVDLGTGNNNKVRRRCTNSTNAGAESCLRLCMAALFQYRQVLTRPCFRLPPSSTPKQKQINFLIPDKQEVIDIIETVYRGARKGRGLVVAPKDYSTKYRY